MMQDSMELVQEVTKQTNEQKRKNKNNLWNGGFGIQICSNILSKTYSFQQQQNYNMQRNRRV